MIEQVYSPVQIKQAVWRLVEHIGETNSRPLHIHVVMDGGFVFAADFVRAYDRFWLPKKIAKINFAHVSRGYSTGKVHSPHWDRKEAPNYLRNLSTRYTHLVLDVCSETGETMSFMDHAITAHQPNAHVVTCALVGIRRAPMETNAIGLLFSGPGFLTGYGMGPRRELNSICKVIK